MFRTKVLGNNRICSTIKENLKGKLAEVLKKLAGSQAMVDLKEAVEF